MPEIFFFIRGLFLFFVGVDKLSQRPLKKAIANLDQLVADPAAVLRRQEIAIGPWRRWGSFIGLALLALPVSFFLAMFVFMLALLLFQDLQKAKPDEIMNVIFVIWANVFVVVLCLVLLSLRGGRCVLKEDGVYLHHRGIEVFCPWALFSAAGEPVVHDYRSRYRVEIPVDTDLIPLVEARKGEWAIAEGTNVKTPQLRIRGDVAVLRPFYAVPAEDLARLLLQLGRRMAASSVSR